LRENGAALDALPRQQAVRVPDDVGCGTGCCGGKRGGGIKCEDRNGYEGTKEASYQPDFPFFSARVTVALNTTEKANDERESRVLGSGASRPRAMDPTETP
jgi:hypothetical protein